MKKLIFVPLTAALILLFGCTPGATPPTTSELTLYFVAHKNPDNHFPNAQKIGCEDFLVPVKTKISGEVTPQKALEILFGANPKYFDPLLDTAGDLSEEYIKLESPVYTTEAPGETWVIPLKSTSTNGHCDTPRVKNQIMETVRAAAQNKPFFIWLNGTSKGWHCFGDESGLCQ